MPGDSGASEGRVHIVVALAPEARPLLDHFSLERIPDTPFPLYQGEGIRLVVSGVGSRAAAAACGYLRGLTEGAHAAWINVGIAGHGTAEIGSSLWAHKVTEARSGQSWYPGRVFRLQIPTSEVVTVDAPEQSFERSVGYDMEAAGFYATAVRFATVECIQVWKVVSDGPASSPGRISRERARELVAGGVGEIEELVRNLRALSRDLARREVEPPELPELLGRWRFSRTQSLELRSLVRRWHLLEVGKEGALLTEVASLGDSRSVLGHLRDRLDGTTLQFPASR